MHAVFFSGEELLALILASKLEDLNLSAVRDCVFSIFAATLLYVEAVSSVRNLTRTGNLLIG
jgi:hypothetical protein